VDLKKVRASELVPNPKNYRSHNDTQRQVLSEIFDEVGIAGAELVRVLPDGRYMLIDGHLRQEEILSRGDQLVPVLITDLDEDEADAVLATFDPISRMAGFDASAMERLVADIEQTRHSRMADVLASVGESAVSYDGAEGDDGEDWRPDVYDPGEDSDDEDNQATHRSMDLKPPGGGRLGDGYHLMVVCESEPEQRRAYELMKEHGFQCRILTL
jgi:ParB-like nuclease domain